MKKAVRLILLGLAIYALALVAMFPARQGLSLAAPLIQQSGVNLAASGVSGTVWTGEATALAVQGKPLGAANWSLAPWRLLLGELGADWQVKPEGGALHGSAAVALSGRTTLTNIEGRLPATQLLALAPPLPLPVGVGGSVSLRLERVVLEQGRAVEATGSVVWHQSELTQPMPLKLGDLKLDLHSDGQGGLVGELKDGGGPLRLEGKISLFPDGRYQLDTLVGARPDADPTLGQALAMLGRADAQGRYRLDFNGRF